jgi:signal transduction histidine kinase
VSEQVGTGRAEVQALQRKIDVLGQLVEVSRVMNSTLALKPLLDFIMQAATEITDTEAASILLVDPRTQELRFEASIGSDAEELAGIVVPREGSIAGTIISEDRALVIDDVARDPRHFQGVDEKVSFQTRSLLGVPMRFKDRLIGVLEVLNKREGAFDDGDVRHITILASQAAVAIENAQLVTALQKAYDDLSKLDKLKSDFIAVASHELRTPLGVILGYASFLKEDAEGQVGQHADAVLGSALHMRALIESMENLQYVQINESELDIRAVPVGNIVRVAYTDVLPLAQEREELVSLEMPDYEIAVLADARLMALALSNVLNNAVKFTPRGGQIFITVEEHPTEARISVRDTGVGLPPDQQEAIFKQFYQVEDPMTRRHGGLGLGLAITQAVIERHGGRIWAESPGKDQGSTFTLTIPLAEPLESPRRIPPNIR